MTLHLSPEAKKDHQLANRRRWVEANRDKVKQYNRKYNEKASTKARKHAWDTQNRHEINRRRREQYAAKRALTETEESVRSSDE